MKFSTGKDAAFIIHFDRIDESGNGIKDSSLNQTLIYNREEKADRVKIEGYLPLDHFPGF